MKPQSPARRNLAGPLLQKVSRSFYLSLRVLPNAVRGELSLAYLLARAADTIADVEALPAELRLRLLEQFQAALDGQDATELQDGAAAFARKVDHAGERELLVRLGECLDWFRDLDDAALEITRVVLRHILHGQRLDLQRFPGPATPAALGTAAELEEYTYLVAGCVGEFWTKLCALRLPGCFAKPDDDMCQLGRKFGQGLQLINILRDFPRDLVQGRCYLPLEEIRASGIGGGVEDWQRDHAPLRPIHEHWRRRADEWLVAGADYVRATKGRRVRFAAHVPYLLGRETLELLGAARAGAFPERIKVPRKRTKSLLWKALRDALLGRA